MCGITGFLDTHCKLSADSLLDTVTKMASSLRHRGPDDSGEWVDRDKAVALGHQRLSIIDVTSHGHQPMLSGDGRYVIVYNGEVYNFKALRLQLETLGHRFKGHSDTEVMLAAIMQWGINEAVSKFVGMFAFGLWDRKEETLTLGRDRFGEKPLYYGLVNNAFLFGSELKALCAYPYFKKEVDRDVLALYLRYNYIPEPYSIYKGIFKLPAGSLLKTNLKSSRDGKVPEAIPYWSAKEMVEKGANDQFKGTADEAALELEELLRDAVKLRMESDVPFGVFLSGGIDSSLVTSLMQAQSDRPVKTFTIGFRESSYNEAEDAKRVARHLGTEHTELYVTPQESLEVIKLLPTLYDEPFADSSQIPTFLVSQMARQHVTVCLSGDGGDELFAGYNRYFLGSGIWSVMRHMHPALKKVMAKAILSVPSVRWTGSDSCIRSALSKRMRQQNLSDKAQKIAAALTASDLRDVYYNLISYWHDPVAVVSGSKEPVTKIKDPTQWARVDNFVEWMMHLDAVTYLPDDILVKVDRASMGVSLETRVVYLDHRVAEFNWRLPLSMKIAHGHGKRPLRKILYKYVPKNLLERPKAGFSMPVEQWLRGPLKGWAEGLLDRDRLKREGFFDANAVWEKWAEHASGKRNWQHCLWGVLMFQAWKEEWI